MESMPNQYCSQCGKALPEDAKFCPGCGIQVQNSGTSPTQSPVTQNIQPAPVSPNQDVSFGSLIGVLMIAGGLFGAIYFFMFFDTSVEVPTTELFGQSFGGGRVNNLGLMADRQNGILFSFGIAIIGAVIAFFARTRKVEVTTSSGAISHSIKTEVNTNERISIKEYPGEGFKTIGYLLPNERYDIASRKDEWIQIKTNDVCSGGWIKVQK